MTIVKESNKLTEQMYSVGVTVSTPTSGNAATLESVTELGDYSLGFPGVYFRQLLFLPDEQEIMFTFILFGDTKPEGTEAFRAIISTIEGTPTFQEPIIAFPNTAIQILDTDSKLILNNYCVITFTSIL